MNLPVFYGESFPHHAKTVCDVKELEELERDEKAIRVCGVVPCSLLKEFSSLTHLSINVDVPELYQKLGEFASLKVLEIYTRKSLPILEAVPEYLIFARCRKLKDFSFLRFPQKVSGLWVDDCPSLNDMNEFSKFQTIKELSISGHLGSLRKFNCLEPLASLRTLEYLELAVRLENRNLAPICLLKNLKKLFITSRIRAPQIQYKQILENCRELDRIELGTADFDLANGFVKRDL